MVYFYFELDSSDSCLFRGNRVPTLEEAKKFFKKTVQYKECQGEVESVEEISKEKAKTLWDLNALENMDDEWLVFCGDNE